MNARLGSGNTYTGGTSVTGGTLIVANSHGLGTAGVAIHTGGIVQLQSGLSQAVLTPAVTFDGSTNTWFGTLDITNDKLIVESASMPTDLSDIRNQLGTAIISSKKPSSYGIAVIGNGALSTPFTTFGGVNVDANSILISPEILGDANADGHVDLTDLSTVLNNFGSATPAWTSGNFDGAATIDLTDLSAVLNNFGLSNPNASVGQPLNPFGSAAVAAEPMSLTVIGMGMTVILCRRRRSK